MYNLLDDKRKIFWWRTRNQSLATVGASLKYSTYMPQLDTLRAVAVLMVVVSHWFSKENLLNRYLPNGTIGVTLFFILSGYLITGILLRNKKAVNSGASASTIFRNFYLRRSLRIFPIYYIVLFYALALNFEYIRDNFYWHFFYLSNFYFWKVNAMQGGLSHFWSLSVEEQFYLFWPALIIYIPNKRLPLLFASGFFVSLFFRIFVSANTNGYATALMPANLDTFCLGAVLSYSQINKMNWISYYKQYSPFLILVFFLVFIALNFFNIKSDSIKTFPVFYRLSLLLFLSAVIFECALGVKNQFFQVFLNNKILIYLGKISYGLYLYHNLIPYVYTIQLPPVFNTYTYYFIQFARLLVLVLISSFSWYVFERPILKFKEKFCSDADRSQKMARKQYI